MRFRSDTVAALVLLIFCGLTYWSTLEVPKPNFGSIGAAFFPRILIFVLSIMTASLFIRSLARDLRAGVASAEPYVRPVFREWVIGYKNVIASFFFFFVFVLVLELLGYMVAGFLFLFVMQLFLSPRTWKMARRHILVSAGVTFTLWVIFRWLLVVLLPEGELFGSF